MTKITTTITIDSDLWFNSIITNLIHNRKLSQTINELLKEYAGSQDTEVQRLDDLREEYNSSVAQMTYLKTKIDEIEELEKKKKAEEKKNKDNLIIEGDFSYGIKGDE